MPAQARPVAAPGRDDATPPPTRNPLLAKAAAEATVERPAVNENSVEMSDSLEDEAVDPNSTQIKENPLNSPRPARPGTPSAARPPVRPPVKR